MLAFALVVTVRVRFAVIVPGLLALIATGARPAARGTNL